MADEAPASRSEDPAPQPEDAKPDEKTEEKKEDATSADSKAEDATIADSKAEDATTADAAASAEPPPNAEEKKSTAAPDDEQLKKTVREIVEQGDLNTLTVKTILRSLEQRFGVELPDKKGLVRNVVTEIVQERDSKNAEDSIVDDQNDAKSSKLPAAKRAKADKKDKKKPAAAAADRQDEASAKAGGDHDGSYVDVDPRLQRLVLEAAKFAGSGALTRRAAAPKPKNKTPPKKRKEPRGDEEVNSDGEGGEGGEQDAPAKKKRKSVFSRPVQLKSALSEFLGETELPRGEIVKRLVAYVKEHGLQSNPKDKRKIIFDEKLQQVFKCKQTDFFKLQKLISTQVAGSSEELTS